VDNLVNLIFELEPTNLYNRLTYYVDKR
jgi:hypothetical protein